MFRILSSDLVLGRIAKVLASIFFVPTFLAACATMETFYEPGGGNVSSPNADSSDTNSAPPKAKLDPVGNTEIGGVTFYPSDCDSIDSRNGPVFSNPILELYRTRLDVLDAVEKMRELKGNDINNTAFIIHYDGPLGIIAKKQGEELYPASKKPLNSLDDAQNYLAMTSELARYCKNVYDGNMDARRLIGMELDAYIQLELAYAQMVERGEKHLAVQQGQEQAYWDKRTAPYLTFTNGEIEIFQGDPLSPREQMTVMDFVRESIWLTIYDQENSRCSFMSTNSDRSRFVFTGKNSIGFTNAFPIHGAVIRIDGEKVVEIIPNTDQGRSAKLTNTQSSKLIERFKNGGKLEVWLDRPNRSGLVTRVSLNSFNEGYDNYQDCLTRI